MAKVLELQVKFLQYCGFRDCPFFMTVVPVACVEELVSQTLGTDSAVANQKQAILNLPQFYL
jgi:hypothetical protein